ncbi:hypothetical protein COO60DRAFT_17607 [Scenedesmus sp. NREL 46B-D3]|nr:hypothetical protein COO60DRAFT_17607 [Scenedesmus sp. NREL 46B-D3]
MQRLAPSKLPNHNRTHQQQFKLPLLFSWLQLLAVGVCRQTASWYCCDWSQPAQQPQAWSTSDAATRFHWGHQAHHAEPDAAGSRIELPAASADDVDVSLAVGRQLVLPGIKQLAQRCGSAHTAAGAATHQVGLGSSACILKCWPLCSHCCAAQRCACGSATPWS